MLVEEIAGMGPFDHTLFDDILKEVVVATVDNMPMQDEFQAAVSMAAQTHRACARAANCRITAPQGRSRLKELMNAVNMVSNELRRFDEVPLAQLFDTMTDNTPMQALMELAMAANREILALAYFETVSVFAAKCQLVFQHI